MLFTGDDLTALLGSLQNHFLIQRLDGRHIDDAGVDTGLFQLLASLDGFIDHQTVSNDRNVSTLTHHFALADLESKTFLMEHRHSQTAKAQVHGALMLISSLDCSRGFHSIRRADDHHAGDGTHQCEIFAALVTCAVLTHGHTAMSSADLHVQLGIANGVANLLKSTARCKHGKAGCERNLTGSSQSCCNSHHIAFRNAAVKVAIRICLGKHTGLGGTCQVRIQNNHIGMLSTQSHQPLAVTFTGSHFLYICHITYPPVLLKSDAVLPLPARTVRHWERHRASLPDSP